MRWIRVVGDGTPHNTKIFDAQTNEDLTARLGVKDITWRCSAGDMSEATITCILAGTDLVGIGEFQHEFPVRRDVIDFLQELLRSDQLSGSLNEEAGRLLKMIGHE